MTPSNPLERIVGRHTRGPWELMPAEPDKPYLRIRGTVIGTRFKIANVLDPVYADVPPWEAEETLANARLIAIAPKLLEALQAAIEWAAHMRDAPTENWPFWFDPASSAVAKALGVSPNAAFSAPEPGEMR